jgi:hypothetical protein
MKRFALLAVALSFAPAAHADMTHKIQSSVQLQVDGAGSISERIGSSYAISGSNINLDTAGGLGALTPGSGVGYTAADYSITTAGDAFSFTESFLEGDATPSATSVSAGAVLSLPILGQTTTTSGGNAGSLAGTIASDHVLTLTAGNAGTSAIGQIVTELSID